MPLRGEAKKVTYLNLVELAGGASQVHRAFHAVFQRDVIQKTVPIRAMVPDAVVLQEPQLLEGLDDPRIPRIYEAQFDPQRSDCVTFVVADVGAFSGTDIVLGGAPPLSVDECVMVGRDLLGALGYLHDVKGVVHRDIKPDNLRLSTDRNRAWLIDFNLAGTLGNDGTVSGVATPVAWLAPDVAETRRYSIRSELFAVGVVLYEMVRGRPMMTDYDEGRAEKRLQVGRRAFPDTHYGRWPPHVPKSLRQVLTKAFARNPESRWGSAAEMSMALGRMVYVDWRPDPNRSDRWVGSWPSTATEAERVPVEVSVKLLRGGPDQGLQRATARYRPGGAWMRLPALQDRTLKSDADLHQFFEEVARRLARLRPAR